MAKAIVATAFGGPEVLELVDVDVQAPGAGEVTIAVKAAGVNPTDYKGYSGRMGADPSKLPMRLGYEVSGVVTAVGEDSVGPGGAIGVGDEVVAHRVSGGYASAITVPSRTVLQKPANVSWEQAAGLLLVGTTAWHLLEATSVAEGDTVLIHGASGSAGLTAGRLALLRGATVIGTASEANFDLLRSYGIQPVAYGSGLIDRVREAAPNGVDVALDAVGTDEALEVSLELVTDRARVATIANFARGAEEGIKVLGGGPGADPGTALRAASRLPLVELAAERKLDVIIAKTFPLAEAAAAHELVRSGHPGGKVILIP